MLTYVDQINNYCLEKFSLIHVHVILEDMESQKYHVTLKVNNLSILENYYMPGD